MNKSTLAKAPKTLPWLAHKAGIDEHRAEILWHAALSHAAHVHAPDTPEYWQAAMDCLLDLLAAESQREDLASFGWRPWARNLADFWTERMSILDEMTLASVRVWRIVGQHSRPSPAHINCGGNSPRRQDIHRRRLAAPCRSATEAVHAR
ncbi:MAG: hypothetical protein FWD62_00910 [Betaproteobacteria bacterium]|nr:hypothetical protein [Betaproteobacteria bacterium]